MTKHNSHIFQTTDLIQAPVYAFQLLISRFCILMERVVNGLITTLKLFYGFVFLS